MLGKFGRYISTWQGLPPTEKGVFLRAALTLVFIKLGLAMLPFATFRKVFHYLTKSSHKKELSQAEIARTVWAVDTAANLLPFNLLCLPRALATKYLLRKLPAVTLEIGIEVNPAKQFEAHAWVEKNGTIIIGNWPETVSYQRIWVWK
jgi:hypothetical protein